MDEPNLAPENLQQEIDVSAQNVSNPYQSTLTLSERSIENKIDINEVHGEGGEDVYETQDFTNLPYYSLESTFEIDPLELEYSYGYDCLIPNMCVVDPDTVLWYTGNIIHIFNTKRKQLSFRRSALGQDISYITKSKAGEEFAVGENGGYKEGMKSPMIIIYKWPGFKVKSVLKGGSTRYYKCLDFNMDGSKLVSQAGSPDYTMTVWDTSKRKAILSLKNPDNAVSKVIFSPYDPEGFITCGQNHIKFWNLTETFTGLKMESTSGRFGEVENNNVSTLYFLSDGRVVSNFGNGNLAIWGPNALLELDFSMKNNEPCHKNQITFISIYHEDNHLYTAGLDGKVRVWNYSYITSLYDLEQQNSVHTDIEPSYERLIKDSKGHTGIPLQMVPKNISANPYHYYMQDVKGGIWLLDLELKKHPDPWVPLYLSHSGPINDISTSPAEYYFASLGEGGKLNVYSHYEKMLVMSKQFKEPGTCILWLPIKVDRTCRSIIIGFSSGILRVVMVLLQCLPKESQQEQVRVIQAIKPHSSSITALTIFKTGSLLVSGSVDKSVFLYRFIKNRECVQLRPIGMIHMPGAVCHITWNQFKENEKIILVACDTGEVVEANITRDLLESIDENPETRITYVLDIPLKVTQAKLRSQKQKSKLYFARYMAENLIWIEEKSTEHRYHNYKYEVGGEPVEIMNISGGQAVQCCLDVGKGRYMLLGLSNGRIKVIKTNPSGENDYLDSWEAVMHKTQNCIITKLCFSYDNKILYSCGTDSGIFVYKVKLPGIKKIRLRVLPLITNLPESSEPEMLSELSLEEEKARNKLEADQNKHRLEVKLFKDKLLKFLTNYLDLIKINKALPKSLRIPKSFFRLQTEQERTLEKQNMKALCEEVLAPLKSELDKLMTKVQKIQKNFIDPVKTPKFYLFAIRKPHYLKSFPERRLYSEDPLRELVNGQMGNDQVRDVWDILLDQNTKKYDEGTCTEFERMVGKVVAKLEKEKGSDGFFVQGKEDFMKEKSQNVQEPLLEEEVPDLITAAGQFLIENNKFTITEKQFFTRTNNHRLKRLKCMKEMEKIEKLRANCKSETEKLNTIFEHLAKSKALSSEKLPSVTQKLYDLLSLRQLIYLKKEIFNFSLKEFRREKTSIINFYYWAQEEYKYMINDLQRWGLDLDNMEMPPPLEIVWELEYPDSLKFKPDPKPSSIAKRMNMYTKELEDIMQLIPIDELEPYPDLKNHKLFPIIKNRQKKFRRSMVIIRETLDEMIEDFDAKFKRLLLLRTQVSAEVFELKANYVSTIQEVDIVYRFQMIQMSVFHYKADITRIKHIHILRENIRKKKIDALKEQINECHKTIEDLNAKFKEMVKDDKWAKHLTRTYRRKYKLPKADKDDKSEDTSESSTDESDDDIDDFDSENDDDTNVAAIAYLYDETIMPPGCDEDKFRQTFKFRSQRHAEENKISEIQKDKALIMNEVKSIRTLIKVADALLALFYAGTYKFLDMMKNEMNEVEYLVKLHPSQVQIFSKEPYEFLPAIEKCKLIEQDDYLTKVKAIREMDNYMKNVNELVLKTQANNKAQVKQLKILRQENKKAQEEIEKLMVEKYGANVDVDEIQTHVLTGVIKTALKRCLEEEKTKEKLQQQKFDDTTITQKKDEMLKTKRDRIKTLQTLYTVQAEKNRIAADQLSQQRKIRKKKVNLITMREELLKELCKMEEEEMALKKSIREN